MISIHALRVEGDLKRVARLYRLNDFYPRPPGGGRHSALQPQCTFMVFLSTPSGWRATTFCAVFFWYPEFLSTPSGWRATPLRYASTAEAPDFYPRPPGGGRPTRSDVCVVHGVDFYPRPPGGGRRPYRFLAWLCRYFYPRPPGGGRRFARFTLHSPFLFLSTPSGWRATAGALYATVPATISIHALRVEGDWTTTSAGWVRTQFLSTPSGWRATGAPLPRYPHKPDFYPRPPGGGRPGDAISVVKARQFLSTPSGWRATRAFIAQSSRIADFYPRPPGGGRRKSSFLI